MNTFLLMLAIFVTMVLFVPLLVVQSLRRAGTLSAYHFNLAKNIDYMWGSLLFGVDGHTVSAICYKRSLGNKNRYKRCVSLINFVFRDAMHCREAYIHEFRK